MSERPSTVFVVFSVREIDQVSVPYVESVWERESDADRAVGELTIGGYVEEYDLR